ncbi:MAG: putative bifunctional diguanylate cyclase/phosphodiesterase, partial [Acidimicrobiales bacterium]
HHEGSERRRSRRELVRELAHPPWDESRFWWTQALVVVVVLAHALVDAGQDHGLWGVPSFVVVPLLLVPVLYGGLSFGLVGALGPALLGVVLLAPSEIWLSHTPLELWGGWSDLVMVVVTALVLGDRFEVTRVALVQRTADAARAREESRFRAAFDDNMAAMAVIGTDGRIQRANAALGDLVGYATSDLVGRDLATLRHHDDEDAAHERAIRLTDDLTQQRDVMRFVRRDGHVITTEASTSAARDDAGRAFAVVSLRDITEERSLTARLADLALHDSLTGLANRALLRDRLAQGAARAQRDGGLVALLLVDLDNFKEVNDTLGHQAGDDLLVAVAQRLRAVTRSSDTVARLGGDEFVYLASAPNDDELTSVGARLLDLFTAPFIIADQLVVQHASIGVATCATARGRDCEDLIRDADVALYEAKRAGRHQIATFTPQMSSRTAGQFQLTQDLTRAIENDEIVMLYQPIVDLRTRTVVGVESLMRWRHPTRGLVAPDAFIPLAERSDLIVQLGEAALRQATAVAAPWVRQAPSRRVGVNLSPRQVHDPRLFDTIDRALDESGLAPHQLAIEVTETVALADVEAAVIVLDHLRHRGISIALDDFGTGYSSLSYLARLHPSIIKIDRSFIRSATCSRQDRDLLAAMVTLCRELDMTVVAEGVESPLELELVVELGADLVQGFLFSPAVEWSDLDATCRSLDAGWPNPASP